MQGAIFVDKVGKYPYCRTIIEDKRLIKGNQLIAGIWSVTIEIIYESTPI